ncbi:hypothetical protein E0Z10_g5309 [Xylaria hypoxylon]|uniref:WKF domain-containing protein n=1 Tax=Xylaria hypoxylon TaxID=37992 RepID=A0A4Z0YGL3_9PEZI|nr:hypothetical protein E0Z10_g5309 [Xylaria hypoxylon]
MSSFHSTGDGPTQRVPAWKRLGLKLKPASEAQSHDAPHHPTIATPVTSSVPNNRAHLGSSTPNAKRRLSGGAPALDHSAKRARQDNWQDQTSSHQTPKKAKSVSFTADTAGPQSSVPVKTKQTKQVPTKGAITAAPPKPIKRSAPVNLEPALAYLRNWHTARESWKFNKNHQTKLLEQVFADADETTIPAVDINVFYEYIRGLQGGVRTRLRELANGVKAQDMEQGASGFAPSGKAEMAERKQKEYEEVIKTFLSQARTPEKRRFDEVEYVLRTTDMEMQRRVVKRMRADMVLDELSDTDESETTTTTTTTTSGESASTEKGNNTETNDDDQRLKLNDGQQQRAKRKRKLRTAAVEDTSSESESEDESDSGTSSGESSSSSGSSDSDEDGDGGARANEETSSSSSSSSSESGSDSEDDD